MTPCIRQSSQPMLLRTSATVQLQPTDEVNPSMALQNTAPHEVPLPDYGLSTHLVPPSGSGLLTPMQIPNVEQPTSISVGEDACRTLTQADGSALLDAVSRSIEPASSSSSASKRKIFGPSKDIYLPPLKKRGRCGPMPHKERIERAAMRSKGACIICRQGKKKCDNNTPCGACRKKFGSGIKNNPCTKAHFLDIVECKPCYPCSVLYESMFLEGHDESLLLNCVTTSWDLAYEGWVALQIDTDVPFSVSVLSPLSQIYYSLSLDPRLGLALEQGDEPPRLHSIFQKSPITLAKNPAARISWSSPSTQNRLVPEDMKMDTLLYFSAALHYKFTLVHDNGMRVNITDEYLSEYAILHLWLATRQCEIFLFRYLQSSANQIGSMSPTDLGRTIMDLLAAMGPLLSRLENTVFGAPTLADTGPDKEAKLSQEVVRQIEDRRKRLRAALFVYAGIASSKLPPFSDFWTQLEKSPLKLPQHTFKKLLADLDFFDHVLNANHGEINVRFPDEPLSDTAAGPSAEIRISQFPLIARIDWERVSSTPHDLGLSVLASAFDCLESITKLEQLKQLGKTDAIPVEIEEDALPGPVTDMGERAWKASLLKFRGDLRWIELRELAGEEICLLERPSHRWLHINDGIQPLDVPLIVRNGSEAEFHRLKVQLTTSHSWIVQCCRQLEGMMPLLKRFIDAHTSGKDSASNLASQIQRRMRDVFGSRTFIHDVVYSQPIASSKSSTAATSSNNSGFQEPQAHETARQREAVDSNSSEFHKGSEGLDAYFDRLSGDRLKNLQESTKVLVERFFEP